MGRGARVGVGFPLTGPVGSPERGVRPHRPEGLWGRRIYLPVPVNAACTVFGTVVRSPVTTRLAEYACTAVGRNVTVRLQLRLAASEVPMHPAPVTVNAAAFVPVMEAAET